MVDFTWRTAYEEWENGDQDSEQAFKAGWFAALAQIISMLEDEHRQGEDQP